MASEKINEIKLAHRKLIDEILWLARFKVNRMVAGEAKEKDGFISPSMVEIIFGAVHADILDEYDYTGEINKDIAEHARKEHDGNS